jgi:hypothetical protein
MAVAQIFLELGHLGAEHVALAQVTRARVLRLAVANPLQQSLVFRGGGKHGDQGCLLGRGEAGPGGGVVGEEVIDVCFCEAGVRVRGYIGGVEDFARGFLGWGWSWGCG